MKALFVVNERSGKKRAFDIADVIRKSAEFEHEILSCGRKEDLDAMIDRAEAEGFDVVFAVGGDGTVHETAKRLIGRKPALGILPIGSGNGFARHIGLPLDPALTLGACTAGRIVAIDTAEVNGAPFLGVMGIGFDAVVAERFASSNVRGLETYVMEGLRAFAEFHAEEYEVTCGGSMNREKAFVIAIANASQYGNNARIAPLASLQDGLLDVVIVHDLSLLRAPLLLARLFNGTLDRADEVSMVQCTDVRIKRPAAGPAHLDGEPFSLPEELHVRVVPRSLRLLVPDAAGAL
ncbi:MAG TPA: YegS/Rv2252/BmrU family lipid kinase [Thermoanaerobaculia bacterium]|nr:YegS/Rv2252/BmrU family lipid kinase [Thermoanaerobaculia bacterium]